MLLKGVGAKQWAVHHQAYATKVKIKELYNKGCLTAH